MRQVTTLALFALSFVSYSARATELVQVFEGLSETNPFYSQRLLKETKEGDRINLGGEVFGFYSSGYSVMTDPITDYPVLPLVQCRTTETLDHQTFQETFTIDRVSTDEHCEGVKVESAPILGYILKDPTPGTTPLARYINSTTKHYWVTIRGWEAEHAGYTFEKILGHVYPLSIPTFVGEKSALWRPIYLHSSTNRYRDSFNEMFSLNADAGRTALKNKGIVFYSLEKPTSPSDVPLYRFVTNTDGTYFASLTQRVPFARMDGLLGYISLTPKPGYSPLRRYLALRSNLKTKKPKLITPFTNYWSRVGTLFYPTRILKSVIAYDSQPYFFHFEEITGYVRVKMEEVKK